MWSQLQAIAQVSQGCLDHLALSHSRQSQNWIDERSGFQVLQKDCRARRRDTRTGWRRQEASRIGGRQVDAGEAIVTRQS